MKKTFDGYQKSRYNTLTGHECRGKEAETMTITWTHISETTLEGDCGNGIVAVVERSLFEGCFAACILNPSEGFATWAEDCFASIDEARDAVSAALRSEAA